MSNTKRFEKVDVSKLSPKEQQARVNKMAFIACLMAVIGLPSSLIGVGMLFGIAGLVMALKAHDLEGRRPVLSIVALVIAILDILLSIAGWIVIYGTYMNPDSEFVQKLVNLIFDSQGIIWFVL